MSTQTRNGVSVSRSAAGVVVSNNRRCRIGARPRDNNTYSVVAAANPGNWHPTIELHCDPNADILCVLEREDSTGPRPRYDGPFEPDDSTEFTFSIHQGG